MEPNNKDKIRIKNNERRVPDSEPKMRYFKIPLCRNFVWKVGDYLGLNDACQWCLRSKIGVWQEYTNLGYYKWLY